MDPDDLRAVIVLKQSYDSTEDLRKIVAHEMGHAIADSLHSDVIRAPKSSNLYMETYNRAIHEYIADINSVLLQNYNGPAASQKFKTNADWVPYQGYSMVPHFDWEDQVLNGNPRFNERVGTHAFYDLIKNQGVSPVDAAYIFFKSVALLEDIDGNKWYDWAEVREATIKAAMEKGPTQTAAVKDAWSVVLVGPNADDSPPSYPAPGAPSAPAIITSSLDNICDFDQSPPGSVYNLNFTAPAGALYYNGYFSFQENGIYLPLEFNPNYDPPPLKVYVPSDVYIRISACGATGCSLMSTTSVFLENQCPTP